MNKNFIQDKKFLEEVIQDEKIYLLIATAISSDNLFEEEDYLASIQFLSALIDIIPSLEEIDNKKKEEIMKLSQDSFEMINKEYKIKFKK